MATEASAATEDSTETETPAATETPAETEVPAVTEAPAATEEPAATEAPIETEAPAATETPAATEAPVKMPAQGFRADSTNGVHVRAWVDEGVLPEDTVIYVRAISASQAFAIAEQTLEENQTVSDAIAVDISFRDSRFKEIEPKDSRGVHVTLTLDNALNGESIRVIHKEDDGTVSVIENAEADADSVTFESGSFSIYVVAAVEQADPRLEVRFFMPGSSEPYNTQYIAGASDLHDPGVVESELTEDDVFVGWIVGGNAVDGIDGVKALVPTVIHAGDKMDVTALIHVERRLVYKRLDGTIKNSEDYIVPKDLGTKTVTVNQSYTVSSGNLGFVGWAEVVNGVLDESKIYKNGDTITLTKPETVLEPVVKEGRWIIFYENDDTVDEHGNVGNGGASYTAPVFYMRGENTEAPDNPTRIGYDFAGWYTAAEGGTRYAFNAPLGDEDLLLYAHWTPSSAAYYTVIIWQQKVSDNKDAADADKTYDYYSSRKVSATTGAIIAASERWRTGIRSAAPR